MTEIVTKNGRVYHEGRPVKDMNELIDLCSDIPLPRKFHFRLGRSKQNGNGSHIISLGFRFGWFPCFKGPFVRFDFLSFQITAWYGWPSYEKHP